MSSGGQPTDSSVSDAVAEAFDYARRHSLQVLAVAREGQIVAESCGEGYDLNAPHALYSGTKSFWGIAAIAAQHDGILRLDERVAETFPDWDADAWKRRVTLRHLLQLTSGIGFGGLGSAVPTFSKALAVKLKHKPGSTFTYGGTALQVFGAVLARKLEPRGQTPHEYLRHRLLQPIGMRIERWRTLADGSHPLPTGAFASAAEWLKFGRLVGDRHEEFAECFQGSTANPRYGLGFWLAPAQAPADLIYASGAGGQAMYIVPSQHLVVVHFGASPSFRHEAFLSRLFASAGKHVRATEVRLRFGLASEQTELEGILRRASLQWEDDRPSLLAHPEVMRLPVAQLQERRVRVAEIGSHVVGFSVVLPLTDRSWELDGLFVEPAHWGQGIGRVLVQDAKDWSQRQGVSVIEVVAGPNAEGFYRKLGFIALRPEQVQFGSASRLRWSA